MFQKIYIDALDEPAIGYAASPVFSKSILVCPKCGGTLWLRHRRRTRTIIGLTCATCPYLSTYTTKPATPSAPLRLNLPNTCRGTPGRLKNG